MSVRKPLLPSSRPAGPAHWIFIPAILLSGVALWITPGEPRAVFTVLALSALLPSLLGICFRTVRAMTGASICAVIVLAWYWLPLLLLLFVVNMGGRLAGGLGLLAYLATFIIPIGIFALAATVSFARTVGARWATGAIITALIPSILLASAAEKQQRLKYTTPHAADGSVIGPDLLALHRCNQEFASANPARGYAESLQQLGPQGTQCLLADLVGGASKGFTIRYEPASRSGDGRIETYSLSVWETAPKATNWTTMYSNQSGLIWYRLEGPTGPTRGWLLPVYPGSNFAMVLRCVGEPDPTRVRIYRGNELLKITSREDYNRNCIIGASFNSPNTFTLDGYEYRYEPSAHGFEVSARPLSYGVLGLRSFLAVGTAGQNGRLSTLNVYATPENRSATAEDPLAMAEELGLPLSTGLAKEAYCGNQLCP